MHFLNSLFHSHALKVSVVNNWVLDREGIPSLKAWIRAEMLVRLDVLIINHRKEFESDWCHLSGKTALRHLVFIRTGWTLEQIDKLSFPDMLFVLQQDLKAVNIRQEIFELPDAVRNSRSAAIYLQDQYRIELPPCSEQEWDHTLAEKAQGLRTH